MAVVGMARDSHPENKVFGGPTKMLLEFARENTASLHPVASPLQSDVTHFEKKEERMAYDKRYVAQKRQRRRRKTAKAKMKLYEQGKLPHDKLPALAKKFLARKQRALSKAE
jgi:hypothetical protein